MAKKFTYRGKTLEELQDMSMSELSKIFPSRQRRTLKKGLTDQQKQLLRKIKELKKGDRKKVKTHLRGMIILPVMVGADVQVYDGEEFVEVHIDENKIGHYLGEFVLTREKVEHSAPGVGATRSSAHLSVK